MKTGCGPLFSLVSPVDPIERCIDVSHSTHGSSVDSCIPEYINNSKCGEARRKRLVNGKGK